MAPAEQRLPNGLLIILHLHLLDFPLQDATGYDERLFDPSRGMRERNKALEDISYFLVGKIERSKERARSILPTYPCLQPSDMTAFRIALAKYIEAIRNSIVHTTHASDKASELKGKRPASPTEDETPAWWWKDIIVRKSILDECCGDRFERLILALSSHAVLKNTTPAPSALQSLSAHEREITSTLAKAYTARLTLAQNERLEWERSAALLVQRQANLAVIRARLADPRHASSSKYGSLDTARLLSLRDSRHQDLQRGNWGGNEGRRALRLITSLAGLLDPVSDSTLPGQETGAQSSSQAVGRPYMAHAAASETLPPLPIAAARHPSHLHALSAPLFPSESALQPAEGEQTAPPGPPHAVSERIAAIEQVQRSLQEALTAAQGIHAQLQQRLRKAKQREAAREMSSASRKSMLKLDAGLWAPRAGGGVVFKPPDSATSLLSEYGLELPPGEGAIEDRIAQIRTAILPPFVAEPAVDPVPEHMVASRLPQSSIRALHPSKAAGQPKGHTTMKPGKTVIPGRPQAQQIRVAGGTSSLHGAAAPAKSGTGDRKAKARATSRRRSRRASAARTRRSTMFGQGEDAEILRIVASVHDWSDSDSDEESAEEDRGLRFQGHAAQPRTPARSQRDLGTRGTLLSTTKKSGPRQSYDIEVHERAAHVPRLPSLHWGGPPELQEEDEEDEGGKAEGRGADDEQMYEGNSMTLADILLHAGHQGNASGQLLGEELEDEMSDWE